MNKLKVSLQLLAAMLASSAASNAALNFRVSEVTLFGTETQNFINNDNLRYESVEIAENGLIYASTYYGNSVKEFNSSAILQRTYTHAGLKGPAGVAYDNGILYVGTRGIDSGIFSFNANTGSFIDKVDPVPSVNPNYRDIVVTDDGRFFVGAWNGFTGSNQLFEIGSDGSLLASFSPQGPELFPAALAINPNTGNLFSLGNRNGPGVGEWRQFDIGSSGDTPSFLSSVALDGEIYYGLEITSDGTLWTYDNTGDLLKNYLTDGTIIGSYDLGLDEVWVSDFAINDSGNVIISYEYEVAAIPEPSAVALFGLAGLGLILRRRR